jgi:membrane protein implicated in regulation of membrane protease activity
MKKNCIFVLPKKEYTEWLSFAIALLVKNIIVLGLLLITMSPSASLAQIVMYSFVTILVYPIFFIVSKFFLKSEKDTSTDENWRKENIL